MANNIKYSSLIWDRKTKQWVKIGGNAVAEVLYGTTEEWNEQRLLRSEKKTIYIYTDHEIIQSGDENEPPVYRPGIKVGDGNAYLIDIPFIMGDYDTLERNLTEHVSNTSIHVTEAEKTFWNNKMRAYVEDETLVITTE